MRWSISIRLCLVARPPSLQLFLRLILVYELITISLPMTFFAYKKRTRKRQPVCKSCFDYYGWLRRNNQYKMIQSKIIIFS